jgi:hypothetical protein
MVSSHQRHGLPEGAAFTCAPNGWMIDLVFERWIGWVVPQLGDCSAAHPALLLLDGHSSRRDFAATRMLSKGNVIMTEFVPHTTGVCQPLDVSCFGPVKHFWHSFLREYFGREEHRSLSHSTVTVLMVAAIELGVTKKNIIKGFAQSGIYPPNLENPPTHAVYIEEDVGAFARTGPFSPKDHLHDVMCDLQELCKGVSTKDRALIERIMRRGPPEPTVHPDLRKRWKLVKDGHVFSTYEWDGLFGEHVGLHKQASERVAELVRKLKKK